MDVIYLLAYHDCYVFYTNRLCCYVQLVLLLSGIIHCQSLLCRQKMQCYADYNNCDKWIMIKYYADFVGNSFDVYFTEHSKIGELFLPFFCHYQYHTILQTEVAVNKVKNITITPISSKFLGAVAFSSSRNGWITPPSQSNVQIVSRPIFCFHGNRDHSYQSYHLKKLHFANGQVTMKNK